MKRIVFAIFLTILFSGGANARRVEKINTGWKFILADIPEASVPSYDDSEWRVLDLPHDWAFENGYSPDGAQKERGGYAMGGTGWYRKVIDLKPEEMKEKLISIDFDAVYMNSEVWINGHHLGKRPYGYISFSYDLTPYLLAGRNVISVRVDNSLEPSARWYHGCGIYGNVTITSTNPTRFARWETVITTSVAANGQAEISVKSLVEGKTSNKTVVEYLVYDQEKNRIASLRKPVTPSQEASSANVVAVSIPIDRPQLWSPESPTLYLLETRLWEGKKPIDSELIRFGIRSTEWKAETGFWLNGENVKFNGVCEHLEGGPVGAAWNEKLMRWKLQLLKNMGCNAIRTAHNPQLPVFYDLCDEIGILVMDEAFDGWNQKADYDYGRQAFARWWERDLRDMIRRDRNHPCVVLYSVGNETRGDVAADLVRVCHEEDPTRMVTSGDSAPATMDVMGINGQSEKQSFLDGYEPGKQAFIGTETPHTWQVRGYYRTKTWYRDGFPNRKQDPFELPDLTPEEIFGYDWTSPQGRANGKQIFNSSYDNAMVRITARRNLEYLRDKPWYSGHFRWTGFDYLGEAGYVHGGWPFRAFMGGVVDMAGFEKDHYYLYQSQWRPQMDMIHVLPHWTHPDMKEGTLIPVWVYTTGDEAELFLNGTSLGRRTRAAAWNRMQCEWLVPWTPGQLKAVAYRNGEAIAEAGYVTAATPAGISLRTDTHDLCAGNEDTAIVTFSIEDSEGNPHPFGENRIYTHLSGNAYIRSFESGNPVDTETNYRATSKRAFFGLVRAFVESVGGGDITLTAGAICGDKSLKQSNMVSIDVGAVILRGSLDIADATEYQIYYTTDGSMPTKNSDRYSIPFQVSAPTTVKATVYTGGKPILFMEEIFGDGSGIYWGNPGAEVFSVTGEQAEKARLTDAEIIHENAMSFVRLHPSGRIEWYQENDGNPRRVNLTIRYALRGAGNASPMALWVNGKMTGEISFPSTPVREWIDTEVKIDILQGANIIELRATGNDAPDIDYILIAD